MYFQEKQSLLNNYTKIILLIPVVIILLACTQKQSSAAWIVCGFALLLTIAVGLLIIKSRLIISEEDDGLKLQVSFLFGQQVLLHWSEIESITLKKISPVLNFGGWGIRYTKNTTGYIFSGSNGVFVKTKKGKVYAFTIIKKDDFLTMLKEKDLPVS